VKRGAGSRSWATPVLILLAIVAACVIFALQSTSSIGGFPFASTARLPQIDRPVVTMAAYELIQKGMSYKQVRGIIGADGIETVRSELAGHTTVMYSWKNRNGSNMNAMFQDGELVTKAQFGLP